MERKLIKYGEGNINGVNMPLIPFNCIIDTDYGLIDLIRREYLDPSTFDVNWFIQNNTPLKIASALYSREHENPLLLFMNKKDDIDTANSLYKEFMQREYANIVDNSMATDILSLIKIYTISGDVRVTVVYENQIELDALNNLSELDKVNKVSIKELNESLSFYQQFYFKSIYDLYINILSDSIRDKTVYLASYKFNLEIDNNLPDSIINLIKNRNRIVSIDMYNREKLFGGLIDNGNI